MIHEYAVDPSSLSSFNEIWQALEQFGVAHGRMLVQCPKKWWGIVKQNLEMAESTLPPAEYKTLEERCFRLKDDRKIIFRKNLKFDGDKSFVEALAAEHVDRPFRAGLQLEPSTMAQSRCFPDLIFTTEMRCGRYVEVSRFPERQSR